MKPLDTQARNKCLSTGKKGTAIRHAILMPKERNNVCACKIM